MPDDDHRAPPPHGRIGGPDDPDPRPDWADPDNPTDPELKADCEWLIRNYRRFDGAGIECFIDD